MAHNEPGTLDPTNWAVICELARLVEMSKGREAGGTGQRVPLTASEIVAEMRTRIFDLKKEGSVPVGTTIQ